MALPIDGFYTPEQDFKGLYQAAESAERQQYRTAQMEQRAEARKLGVSNYLSGMLDKKDFLTGTNYDPEIVRQLNEAMQEGSELASKGADTPTIMMALGPKISRLSEYSTKAKQINQRIKDQIALIPQTAGYDKRLLEEEAKKLAFYGDSKQLKDIASVDPNMDWITETVKLYPERVTTDTAIDEFVKSSPKFSETKDITSYSPTGGMSRKKVKITSPDWLTTDTDQMGATTGLVPRYEVALNNGQPIVHEFEDASGKKINAPVRLLDEQLFKTIMSQRPGIADWVRGQVNRTLKEYKNPDGAPIDINSPQATNVARAILYDELKNRRGGSIEDVEIQNKPSAPEIRMHFTGSPYPTKGSSGSASGELQIRDIYQEVDKKVKEQDLPFGLDKIVGTPLNELSASAQKIILEYANKLLGGGYTQSDISLRRDKNSINIISSEDGKVIAPIDFGDINIAAQPSVKEKREVIKQSKDKSAKKEDPLGIR